MGALVDQHLLELALVDLSKELSEIPKRFDLDTSEKAQRLIEISRSMREVSSKLRQAIAVTRELERSGDYAAAYAAHGAAIAAE
ncbi:MAG: hypothetical protein AAF909_08385 [Pseudomonadota bacterium]